MSHRVWRKVCGKSWTGLTLDSVRHVAIDGRRTELGRCGGSDLQHLASESDVQGSIDGVNSEAQPPHVQGLNLVD